MAWQSNLSPLAELDLAGILYNSIKSFGIEQTKISETRILTRCRSIQQLHTIGHRIDYIRIRGRQPALYHYEQPWMIAFDPTTREIIRIFHGRRDLSKLLR